MYPRALNLSEWSTGAATNCITVTWLEPIGYRRSFDLGGCFQRLPEEVVLNPLPAMHHHRRQLPAKVNPASFARPGCKASTARMGGRDVQLHHSGHAGHLFGHGHRPEEGCFSVCSEEVILNRCRNAPSHRRLLHLRGRIQRALHPSGCRQHL